MRSGCSTRSASGAAHVVGASMGGFIAQLIAINHPERVLTLTSIMSGPAHPESDVADPRGDRSAVRPAGGDARGAHHPGDVDPQGA